MGYLLLVAVAVAAFIAGILFMFLRPDEDYAFKTTFTVYNRSRPRKRPKKWVKLVFENPDSREKGQLTFENYLANDIRIEFEGRSPFLKDVYDVPAGSAEGPGTSGPLFLDTEDPGTSTKKFNFKVLIDDGNGNYATELDPGVKVRRG